MNSPEQIGQELTRLIKRMKKLHMTSQNINGKTNYKCPKCKDIGLIENEDGSWKECECQVKERLLKLWENFGIKPNDVKKLNDYKPYDKTTQEVKKKGIEYIKNFDSFKNNRKNSFGMFGQPGAGKSHIVIAIGAALLNRDNPIKTVYMPYLEAIRELKSNSMDDEYYLKLSSRYSTAELLIIDDLFKDKVKNGQLITDRYGNPIGLNEADMRHIMPIINYRYINHLPMLISTECTPTMLRDLDGALAGRILEPCGDNIFIFEGEKYNYRMRKFAGGANG